MSPPLPNETLEPSTLAQRYACYRLLYNNELIMANQQTHNLSRSIAELASMDEVVFESHETYDSPGFFLCKDGHKTWTPIARFGSKFRNLLNFVTYINCTQ